MASPAQLFTQNADLDVARRQAQHNLERQQQQNTVGMRLLDSINQASSIKPQIKDPNTGQLIDNPAYAQAQKDRADLMAQYSALNAPEAHASFGQHLHGLIFGHADHRPQQPALSPNSSPNEPSQPAAQGQAPAPSSASPAPLHPMAPAPPDHPIHAISKGIKALGDHLSAFAHPLPQAPAPDVNLMAKYYRDPAEVAAERAQALANVRGQYTVEAAKARGANVRPFHVGDANTQDAIAKLKLMPGIEYQDEAGNPITEEMLSEAPPYMKLAEFRQGPNTFYKLIDQRSKETNIGGVKYQVNELGAIKPEASTVLGNQNPDKDSTHQVPGMNPGEVVTLHSTQAPERTGMAPAPQSAPLQNPSAVPPAPAGEPANPTLKTRSQSGVPSLPPTASQTAQTDKLNAKRSASRQIPTPQGKEMPPPFAKGTMLSQGRSAQPVVAAMNTVAAQVFGGNGEKPIWENAWMFDKPELRAALNKALTLNALAIPGTEDDPSFTQTLATAVGATGWSQDQIRQANQEARDNLQRLGGDQALSMFARMAGLQEDLSALRTATKASAAQGSIRTLVRAAPVYNVSSSKNFRDQLGVTLNTAEASMRGYPAINPAYLDWWKRGASAARGGPVSSSAPSPQPARPSNVPEGYVFKENGPKGKGWYAPTAAR